MNAQGFRLLRLATIGFAALMLGGCMIGPMLPRSDAYEYRYRVLQAGRPLPSTMRAPLPIQHSRFVTAKKPRAAHLHVLREDGCENRRRRGESGDEVVRTRRSFRPMLARRGGERRPPSLSDN